MSASLKHWNNGKFSLASYFDVFMGLPEISAPLPKRFKSATFPRSKDLYIRASPKNANIT